MNTCHLDDKGNSLAIQRFDKGFDSRGFRIVKVSQKKDRWNQEEIVAMPFIHRFCTVNVNGDTYMACCILCEDKESKEDWNQSRLQQARFQKKGQRADAQTILSGIHRNYGLFKDRLNGEEFILITGEEGVFIITPPRTARGSWLYEQILPREASDCTVIDLDGDGTDKLVAIEEFHGRYIVINHLNHGEWVPVHDYPVEFGHAIWSGFTLGKP